MSSPDEIAKAFVQHYYQTFDNNRAALASLYQEVSTLSFEGAEFKGVAKIVEKLTAVGTVAHNPQTIDVQVSASPNALLVFVTGQVIIDNSGNPIKYCEVFQLVAASAGNFYVHNNVFRLNYA